MAGREEDRESNDSTESSGEGSRIWISDHSNSYKESVSEGESDRSFPGKSSFQNNWVCQNERSKMC